MRTPEVDAIIQRVMALEEWAQRYGDDDAAWNMKMRVLAVLVEGDAAQAAWRPTEFADSHPDIARAKITGNDTAS